MIKRLGFLVLSAALTASGQGAYELSATVEPSALRAGGSGTFFVRLALSEGFHVTAPGSGLFEVVPDTAGGIEFGAPQYPAAVKDAWGDVYKGKVSVPVSFRVRADASPGARKLEATVTVQQCGEAQGVCYAPEDVRVEAALTVESGVEDSGAPPAARGERDLAGRVSDALEKGSIAAFLLVFLGGLLTSLTPCVYPMIPITMAVIGAQSSGKKAGGFVLSLFYVLGIGITFSVLGMAAAKTGSLFGSFMSHPAVTVLIAVLFFAMGLSMLGAFVMQLPPALASRLRGRKRTGFLGALLTGIAAGLIVSPCISPLLVVILAWVAKQGSLLLGFGLLFSFAMGLGVLFVVIGTFSGALRALPKTGVWAELIERGFGLMLVALALVFLRPVLGPFLYACAWAAALVVAGTFLGAFTPIDAGGPTRGKIAKSAAVLLVMTGGILLFSAITGRLSGTASSPVAAPSVSRAEGPAWLLSETGALNAASSSGKPVLVDFAADWCAACRELDEKTWPDPSVLSAAGAFIPLRLDMTENTESVKALQKKFGILGMPTVLVLSPEGRELGRFTGFRGPAEVVRFLEAHVR
jgi:thiol:disulfide interchange protein DsbD